MPIIGARAAIDLALPTGIDGAKVLQFLNHRSNLTAEQVIAQAAAIIGAVNTELAGRYDGLFAETQTLYAYGVQGTTTGKTPIKAEFKRADGVRTENIGHMLPIHDYEDAVEWTPQFLRDAFQTQIDGDLQLIADRWRNRVSEDIWRRALTNTETLIGSAGYDVPWAIGTGMNVNFIPMQWKDFQFDSTHTHFVVKDDASNDWDDLLLAMHKELLHHGHTGRAVCFTSFTNVPQVRALASDDATFVKLQPAGFQIVTGGSSPIQVATGEVEGMPGELYGYITTPYGAIEMRWDGYVPAKYAFMTHSYGRNNGRNALALRTHPSGGFGLAPKPQVTSDINPELDFVKFEATHGVGVNDRTNGVAGYIETGASSWVNPF